MPFYGAGPAQGKRGAGTPKILKRKEASMVEWLAVLAFCQLAGEIFAQITRLPVPGPVWGMMLLFGYLVWNGRVPDGLGKVANTLLSNLSLLFVPAGAGVMMHFSLLAGDWLPLSVALVVSTLVTIGVTASAMAFLSNRPGPAKSGGQGD
jgi:holin-like protein